MANSVRPFKDEVAEDVFNMTDEALIERARELAPKQLERHLDMIRDLVIHSILEPEPFMEPYDIEGDR